MDNFGVAKADEAMNRFGVDLKFPASVLGGEYEGVYLPEPSADGYGDGFLVVYRNDAKIRVTRWPTSADAQAYLATHNPIEFRSHVQRVDVNGDMGYAADKVDIAPVSEEGTDPATGLGRIKPGTGLYTPASVVAWTRGRFVVEVLSRSALSGELMSAARETRLEPRASQ